MNYTLLDFDVKTLSELHIKAQFTRISSEVDYTIYLRESGKSQVNSCDSQAKIVCLCVRDKQDKIIGSTLESLNGK